VAGHGGRGALQRPDRLAGCRYVFLHGHLADLRAWPLWNKGGRAVPNTTKGLGRKEGETDVTHLRHTSPVPESVTCAVCGVTVPELPLTWSSQLSERGQTYLCERCTRENVRSIEGKLDEAWW